MTHSDDSYKRADDGFVVLPIRSLKVDRSYQRRYDHAMVLDILSRNGGKFDMVWAGPILVNRRATGGHYVIDGQHRTGMAREAGETEVLVELLLGLTQEQEAELRVAHHARKADNRLEQFHARIAAGDIKAIHIKAIVEDLGGKIAEEHSSPTSHIRAVGKLERLYDKSPDLLVTVLKTIRDSFGSLHRGNATSYMLGGLEWLEENHSFELNRERLIRRLQSSGGTRAIDSRARVLSAAGGSMWKNYYRAIVERYNVRTPNDERLTARNG